MTGAGRAARFARLLSVAAIAGVASAALPVTAAVAQSPRPATIQRQPPRAVLAPAPPRRHHAPSTARRSYATAPTNARSWAPHPIAMSASRSMTALVRSRDAVAAAFTSLHSNIASVLAARAPPACR